MSEADRQEHLQRDGKHLAEYQTLEKEATRLCAVFVAAIQAQPKPFEDFDSLPEAQPFWDAQKIANDYYEENIRRK